MNFRTGPVPRPIAPGACYSMPRFAMVVPIPERIRPLRRVEYDKLIELGAFQNERIELLDGVVVPMSPIGPPHASAVQKLTELLVPALLGRASVRIQNPFAALENSEPEPDVVVAPRSDYDTAHPADAHLIIEVSDSSLSQDRGKKGRIYAECGAPALARARVWGAPLEASTPLSSAARSATQIFIGLGVQ
jgi:Uma2 family endonuclease